MTTWNEKEAERLRNEAERLDRLARSDWRPSRADIEGLRNELRDCVAALAKSALSPSRVKALPPNHWSDVDGLGPSPATVTEGMREAWRAHLYDLDALRAYAGKRGDTVLVDLISKDMRPIDQKLRSNALSPQSPTHRNKKTGAEYVLVCEGKMRASYWYEALGGDNWTSINGNEVTTLHSATEGYITVPSEVFVAEYEGIAHV